MVDFIDEVDERVRAERYAGLARRFLPLIVAAIVATIIGWLGVWGYDTWRTQQIGKASIAYDKAIAALSAGDQDGGFNDLNDVAKNGTGAYRALALMLQGDIRFGANKNAEAVALFDAAARAAPTPVIRDLARLRAASAAMDTVPYDQIVTRLKPLIGDKQPYTMQARELLAMAKLQAGRTQEARGDFNALTLALGVTSGMRSRAQEAIALIDSGQAALVGQVVKAAATLPPPAETNVPGLPGAEAPGVGADAQDQDAPQGQDPAGNDQ